jgi:mono/diheme cytochrome c family protein
MPVRRLLLALPLALALPAGADTLEEQVEAGGAVFAEHCAICHGENGEGAAGYPNAIVDTSGLNKFSHARGLYDYNLMMMPFDDPTRVGSADTWKVTAWLMAENGWLDGIDEPIGPDNAAEIPIGE